MRLVGHGPVSMAQHRDMLASDIIDGADAVFGQHEPLYQPAPARDRPWFAVYVGMFNKVSLREISAVVANDTRHLADAGLCLIDVYA